MGAIINIEEIEESLPNGLHDSLLRRIELDYEKRGAEFHLSVQVSVPEDKNGEKYRNGKLTISDVAFIAIDPPVDGYPFLESSMLSIDSGPGQPHTSPVNLPTLPKDTFLHWFYIRDWNSFIRIAAKHAEFRWDE